MNIKFYEINITDFLNIKNINILEIYLYYDRIYKMSESGLVLVEKMYEDVVLPSKQLYDAGYDIRAYEDYDIYANSYTLISTGLKIQLPTGTYGRLASRSGLALKNIEVGAGVVDSNYRGEVKVLLRNLGNSHFTVKKNDRIAQLIVSPYVSPMFVEGKLDNSDRNEKGFGSSGVN